MSAPNPFNGECLHCGRVLAKAAATRHVTACAERPVGTVTALHLVVESAHYKDFWLHVIASSTSKLSALDRLLRGTWLECCGHLSSFDIAGERYDSSPDDGGWGTRARSMNASLGSVLAKGSKFKYEYDFGSTTALIGRCVGVVEGVPSRPAVRLVARNHLPKVPCEDCGEPAAWLGDTAQCLACTGLEDAEACAASGLLPVVNSPRMGVCGYVGPLRAS